MLQREVERDLARKQGRSACASSRSNWPTGLMSQPKPSVAGFLLRTRSAPRNVRTTRICGCLCGGSLCGDGALPRPARRRTRNRRLCCRRRVHHRTTDYRLAGKISAFFIIPGGFVVHLFLRIETGEQPVVGLWAGATPMAAKSAQIGNHRLLIDSIREKPLVPNCIEFRGVRQSPGFGICKNWTRAIKNETEFQVGYYFGSSDKTPL